jgi:predicted dehydrogenase
MGHSDKITVACLGAGYFSRFHYDAWTRLDDVDLLASADADVERAAATGLPAYGSLSEMLAVQRPDVLDIITPPPSHASAIETAVAAGVKTLICQKPFCQSLEEAEAMIALADAADVRIIIHENFRFQPWFREIKAQMDSGRLGDIHQVTFRARTGDGQGPDAYLDRQPYFQTMPRLFVHETGVHWIDTFRYLLGDVRAVYADLRRMNPVIKGEDAAYIVMDHGNGVRSLLDGNRLLDHASENTRITFGEALVEGTKGTLALTGDGAVTFRAFGALEPEMCLPAQDWPGFAGDCVYALNAHVIAALKGQGVFENEAAEYLAIRRIEELVYQSDREGRRIDV